MAQNAKTRITPFSVVLIEDSVALRETLKEQLEEDGEFKVVAEADTIHQAEGLLTSLNFDVDGLLLNVGLPDGDGRDYYKTLRMRGFERPILFLTGRHLEVKDFYDLAPFIDNFDFMSPWHSQHLLDAMRRLLRTFDQTHSEITLSKAHIDVLRRLDEAEAALRKLLPDRFGIGGNRPPESAEATTLGAPDVADAVHAIETARKEVLSQTPNSELLRKCAEVLWKTSIVIAAWIVKRGETGLDEAIKYFARIAAAGYALEVTDAYHKLATVVHSLETLIPMLHP